MSVHDDHHERYSDRKKKSQRPDLESLKQNLFKGDAQQMDNIMKEYRNIQKEKKTDIAIDESANNPINEHKNRYPDVLPYKSTAVRLQFIDGIAGSDYINANFVTDLSAPADRPSQKYICCQAPLVQTFNDFWRMVWEQHAPLIVMITNLVEGNKIKADTYWPTRVNQILRYGLISVKLTREYHRGHSVMIRTFHIWKNPPPQSTASTNFSFNFSSPTTGSETESPRDFSGSDVEQSGWGSGYNSGDDHFSFSSSSDSELEPIDGQEVRKVTQLHCTKWPDFGVPESAQVMKDLVYELELRKRRLEDPLIVHCSAGIGRTGTFVAIHQALQKDLHGELISIRDIVRNLRSQRIGMVQSKEQYIFLYGVVAEMLRDRDSLLNIRSKRFKRFSYIPSRNEMNDAVASQSLHAPTDKSHLFSTSPRLRESVNQHLILTQSSPFASLEMARKGLFHEKIIDHSLTSSASSITPKSLSNTPTQYSSSVLNQSSTKVEKPILKSRESSPHLKVSGSNSLAKSTEISKSSDGIEKAEDTERPARPRGRSMPFLMNRRSKSEEIIQVTPSNAAVFINSGDSYRTVLSSASPRANSASATTSSSSSVGSAPQATSPRHLPPSINVMPLISEGSKEDSGSSLSRSNRAQLRVASDAVNISPGGSPKRETKQ